MKTTMQKDGTIKTTRQTAGNNATLRAIKAYMNKPIYAGALARMNQSGPEAVKAYLGQFFNDEYREIIVSNLMDGIS
jgi:hypothetical protein